MLRLDQKERLYISEDLRMLAHKLNKDGVLPSMVDLLFLGFGHAIQNNLLPAKNFKRHALVPVSSIMRDDWLLAATATAYWYAENKDLPIPQSSSELLDLICSLGIAGANELQERWANRSKSMIIQDILGK